MFSKEKRSFQHHVRTETRRRLDDLPPAQKSLWKCTSRLTRNCTKPEATVFSAGFSVFTLLGGFALLHTEFFFGAALLLFGGSAVHFSVEWPSAFGSSFAPASCWASGSGFAPAWAASGFSLASAAGSDFALAASFGCERLLANPNGRRAKLVAFSENP